MGGLVWPCHEAIVQVQLMDMPQANRHHSRTFDQGSERYSEWGWNLLERWPNGTRASWRRQCHPAARSGSIPERQLLLGLRKCLVSGDTGQAGQLGSKPRAQSPICTRGCSSWAASASPKRVSTRRGKGELASELYSEKSKTTASCLSGKSRGSNTSAGSGSPLIVTAHCSTLPVRGPAVTDSSKPAVRRMSRRSG